MLALSRTRFIHALYVLYIKWTGFAQAYSDAGPLKPNELCIRNYLSENDYKVISRLTPLSATKVTRS